MKRTSSSYNLKCPVARTLDLIGERWTILILRDLLLQGPRKFQDFEQSLTGISPNTLSARLKKLEEHANALVKISTGAEFLTAHKTEDYMIQARVFREAAAKIATRASEKNLDGATLGYLELSVNCVKCHQYTRTRKRD